MARRVQLVSVVWKQLCTNSGVQQRMGTTYQPSIDGHVERVNKTLKEMLRTYVSLYHND